MMNNRCVLLESDEQIIADIEQSLLLINIETLTASSVEEAKRFLLEDPRSFVLARLAVDGDGAAGPRLAEDCAFHPELKEVPVFAICLESEINSQAQDQTLFRAILPLPVVFPSFTYRIQELLEDKGPSVGSPARSSLEKVDRNAEGSFAVEEGKKRELKSPPPMSSRAVDRNLLTLYALQLEVLNYVRESGELEHCAPELLPKVLLAATKTVTEQVDLKKFLS